MTLRSKPQPAATLFARVLTLKYPTAGDLFTADIVAPSG
jgi:hypothetical protein